MKYSFANMLEWTQYTISNKFRNMSLLFCIYNHKVSLAQSMLLIKYFIPYNLKYHLLDLERKRTTQN